MQKNSPIWRALALALPLSLVALPPALQAQERGKAQPGQSKNAKAGVYTAPVIATPYPAEAAQHMTQLNADRSAPVLAEGAEGAAVIRAQVMLDRAWFSPGEIDGRFGSNMTRAVRGFQLSRNLPVNGTVDAATWNALSQQQGPVYGTYTLTEQDLGPYRPVPHDPEQQAQLKELGYNNALEALAERFHVSPKLLGDLNRGRPATAGTQIVVTDITRPLELPAVATSVRVDKSDKMLYVLGDGDRVLAGFPVTFGGAFDPLPVGTTMRITSKVKNPEFSYNPELLRNAKTDKKVQLPPGPNNPVGVMWMGLTREHWGIHGTPEPAQLAKTESSGCIRLTNWDVLRLATVAGQGMPVFVQS
jgi:lipoprotein-anchoring transpeptidase ErfK/SrfK